MAIFTSIPGTRPVCISLLLLLMGSHTAFTQSKSKSLPSEPEPVHIIFNYDELQADSIAAPYLAKRYYVLTDSAKALYEQRFISKFNDYSLLMKVGNYPLSAYQLSMFVTGLEPGYKRNKFIKRTGGFQGYAVMEEKSSKDTMWTCFIRMRRGTDLGANNEDVKNRLYNAYGMAARYLVLRSGINKSKDVDKHILAELYDENEKKEAVEMHIPERRKYRRRAIFLTIGGGSAMATGFLYAAFTAIMNMEKVHPDPNHQYDFEKADRERRRA